MDAILMGVDREHLRSAMEVELYRDGHLVSFATDVYPDPVSFPPDVPAFFYKVRAEAAPCATDRGDLPALRGGCRYGRVPPSPRYEAAPEADTAGIFTLTGGDYLRIQLLSVPELLEEHHKPLLPPFVLRTYQQAEHVQPNPAGQQEMFG